mgnify:CR=1 FL=1
MGETPDLSDSSQQNYVLRNKLGKGSNNNTKKQKEEYLKYLLKTDETKSDPFEILGGGCSWYCGASTYKVIASSSLSSNGQINYSAKSAHDLSYRTTWVEGVPGDGIGEFLEYYFKNDCPRVTTIIISNGYVKSDRTWKENSRVKTLKLYLNQKPFAILSLADSKANQIFKLEKPIGRYKDGKDMVLKFEIAEIYKGDKFDDTAITEIYFDGIDVH